MTQINMEYIMSIIGKFAITLSLLFGGMFNHQDVGVFQEHLKLKSYPSRILYYTEKEDVRCSSPKDCRDYGKIIKYLYADNEVQDKTFTGVININGRNKTVNNLPLINLDYNKETYRYSATTSVSVFYGKVPYVREKSTGKWFTTSVATTTPEAFNSQYNVVSKVKSRILSGFFPGFFQIEKAWATTDTFYPDTGSGGTTTDGIVRRAGNESWSSIISGAGSLARVGETNDYYIDFETSATTNNFILNTRMFFGFNVSIGSDRVDSATLSFYANGAEKYDDMGSAPSINIYSASPASNNNLATTDYNNVGSTAFSTAIPWASIGAGYLDFSFNASGVNSIQNGVNNFSVRTNYDATGTSPTWSANTYTYNDCRMADYAGTTSDPKLVIVHSAPPPLPVQVKPPDVISDF